jgi:hypothetical protein
VLALAFVAACRPSGAGSTPPNAEPGAAEPETIGYPGTLRPPADAGFDFQWQQHVVAHWEGHDNPFDAVLSKTGDELLLIGLGPMHSPGFIVRLEGDEIEFENRTKRKVPFNPQYIMLDVQRVYFPWIPGQAPADGTRMHERDGEIIEEIWSKGHLVERRFRREDARPPGEIVVRYSGWEDGADAPRRAELDNGWFGYRLEIETLVQQRL